MKLPIKNNYILAFCVLTLAVICFLSVNGPIRFKQKSAERELVVKERLLKIRVAEEKYRKQTGVYTADFSKLSHMGLLADSLQLIPYSDNRKFIITATVQVAKSGKQIPLMECSAGYHDYLDGLDENAIANLIEEANESGRFPGLKIGDITTDNNNAGNWE